MQLSYTTRLICLALCGAGLLQLLFALAAWLAGPLLLRQALLAHPRRAEQALFLLALFARLSPPLLVLGFWLPAYIRGEENASAESVGLVCLSAAACVLAWCLFSWFRAAHAWINARHCSALCSHVGSSAAGLPILLYPGSGPLLAVVGVFRPRILISQALLAPGRISSDALELAFAHEHAHARQRDNLKLLVLSLLPHIPFATAARPSLDQLWRLAAEMAADEDGLTGHPERSVLLAELLVTMARETMVPAPRGSFGLLSRADDLRLRVDRLLARQDKASPRGKNELALVQSSFGFVTAVATLLLLGALCNLQGHRAAEALLHAGLFVRASAR